LLELDLERWLPPMRERLETDRWQRLYETGWTMSAEAAARVADALTLSW
jgi:hypothetical protein